jgi:hypothetical protein
MTRLNRTLTLSFSVVFALIVTYWAVSQFVRSKYNAAELKKVCFETVPELRASTINGVSETMWVGFDVRCTKNDAL